MELNDYIFSDEPWDYNAMYGWQENFGDNMINFGYINSYKEAADDLVEMKHPDLYIFPIIFSYRQYLELLLKNIYVINKIKNKDDYEKFIKKVSHNLSKVWQVVKPILQDNHKDEDIDYIEELIDIIHKLDPYSDKFRYPEDRKQNKSIKQDLAINTYNLKESIDTLDDILRYTYDSI